MPARAPLSGGIGALAVAAAIVVYWSIGTEPIDLPWFLLTGSRLVLHLDALAAPLMVMAAGLAAAVIFYTGTYLPHHLREQGRDIAAQGGFCILLLLFMLSMLLLFIAQDLLVIFVALELTALFSFLLINFDREKKEARAAALTALLVTAGSALLYLLGLLLISASQGTTVLAELAASGQSPGVLPTALVAAGLLAKSAQMPLHFWLPRAMVAPTPVSAYLHSAALVTAGVFVLLRLEPLLDHDLAPMTLLKYLGFVSAIVGGLFALAADELKAILAWSTIAQYGHVLVLVSMGGDHAVVGAAFFIVAHALCKAPLFLTAGAMTCERGVQRLSEARESWRKVPWLAGLSLLAAAGLAGLPATGGYFKEELFFAAVLEEGILMAGLAVLAAALTVGYMARFWWGLFGSSAAGAPAQPFAPGLVLPIAALVLGLLLTGLLPGLMENLFTRAGERDVEVDIAYHLEWSSKLAMTLLAWTLGALVFALRHKLGLIVAGTLGQASLRFGPAALAASLAAAARRASGLLHYLEVRDLRDRIAIVIVPAVIIVFLGGWGTERLTSDIGYLSWEDTPLMIAMLATAIAAVGVARSQRLVDMVMLLSFVGFGLALIVSIVGAVEVAIVLVIVETLFTLLFIALLARLPTPRVVTRKSPPPLLHHRFWMALLGGGMVSYVSWTALDEDSPALIDYYDYVVQAHAQDPVTAIIADFRGLDTLGEITVLVVALVGAISIYRRART